MLLSCVAPGLLTAVADCEALGVVGPVQKTGAGGEFHQDGRRLVAVETTTGSRVLHPRTLAPVAPGNSTSFRPGASLLRGKTRTFQERCFLPGEYLVEEYVHGSFAGLVLPLTRDIL